MGLNDFLQREQSSAPQLIMMRPEDLQSFADDVVRKALARQPKSSKVDDKYEKPLTQKEAAQFLGRSRQTLNNWRTEGKIKAYTIGGRIYYKASELLEALE